jgi:hypothetical protein
LLEDHIRLSQSSSLSAPRQLQLPASVTAAVHRSQNPSKQLVAGPASFGVWSFPFFCTLQGDATAKPCSNNSGLQFNQCFGQWGSFHPWGLYFSGCHDTVAYLKGKEEASLQSCISSIIEEKKMEQNTKAFRLPRI